MCERVLEKLITQNICTFSVDEDGNAILAPKQNLWSDNVAFFFSVLQSTDEELYKETVLPIVERVMDQRKLTSQNSDVQLLELQINSSKQSHEKEVKRIKAAKYKTEKDMLRKEEKSYTEKVEKLEEWKKRKMQDVADIRDRMEKRSKKNSAV